MIEDDAYAHARHAGNAGDVFKHVALAALAGSVPEARLYVESHAGDGLFTLGSVGEWGAGVSQLWSEAPPAGAPDAIDRWLAVVRGVSRVGAARPERYPGSPLLARELLPPGAALVLHERSAQAAQALRRALEPRAAGKPAPPAPAPQIVQEDGFEGLPRALAAGGAGAGALALIDPPYADKSEWDKAGRALAEARRSAPEASLLLWYPIKALTRPRALLASLARLGVHGTAVELVWTPLRLQRPRLNGSGVVFAGAKEAAVRALCAALPRLGPRLSTQGEWSAAQIGF